MRSGAQDVAGEEQSARPMHLKRIRVLQFLILANLWVLCLLQPLAAQRIPGAKLKWLLDYEGKSENQAVLDKRFGALLDAAVPTTRIQLGAGPRSNQPLKSAVLARIAGVPGEVKIRDGRYVMLTACIAHACVGTHGFMWIDTVQGIVIGGLEHDLFAPEKYNFTLRPSLLLFSRQLRAIDFGERAGPFPVAFRQDLADWLVYTKREYMSAMASAGLAKQMDWDVFLYAHVRFLDRRGEIATIEVSGKP